MSEGYVSSKTAEHWLDRACTFERGGLLRQAEIAFKQAMKRDLDEGASVFPQHQSLPRG